MASGQSNTSIGDNATHIGDGVATSLVISSNATFKDQSVGDNSADSALSSAEDMKDPASTFSAQSPPPRPLWNTREGRIAGFRRTIEKNLFPENCANLEALIRYYEDGGKVPEGDEEVWAFDGQASFGIRKYTSFDQMPEGWLHKHKYCDVSGFLTLPKLIQMFLSFVLLRLITNPSFLLFSLELEVLSNQLRP